MTWTDVVCLWVAGATGNGGLMLWHGYYVDNSWPYASFVAVCLVAFSLVLLAWLFGSMPDNDGPC